GVVSERAHAFVERPIADEAVVKRNAFRTGGQRFGRRHDGDQPNSKQSTKTGKGKGAVKAGQLAAAGGWGHSNTQWGTIAACLAVCSDRAAKASVASPTARHCADRFKFTFSRLGSSG